MQQIGTALVAVIGSIITLAIISVLVGKGSQTSGVIQASGSALSQVIAAAVSPANSNNGNLGLNTFSSPLAGLQNI